MSHGLQVPAIDKKTAAFTEITTVDGQITVGLSAVTHLYLSIYLSGSTSLTEP